MAEYGGMLSSALAALLAKGRGVSDTLFNEGLLAPAPPPGAGMAGAPSLGPAQISTGLDMMQPGSSLQTALPGFVNPGMPNDANSTPPIDRPVPSPARPLQRSMQAAGVPTPAVAPAAPPGAAGDATATAAPEDQLARIRRQQADLEKEYQTASAEPNYDELRAQMADRRQAYLPGAMAAVLAGMGPSAGRVLQKGMMARADEARSPLKIEGGQISAEGDVMLDPGFQRQRRIETLTRRIDALSKLEAAVVSDREKIAAAREKWESEQQLRRELAADRAANARALAAGLAGQGARASTSDMVLARTGEPVNFDRNALPFVWRRDAQGNMAQVPVVGEEMAKRIDPTKDERGEIGELRTASSQATRLSAELDALKGKTRGTGPIIGTIAGLSPVNAAVVRNYVMTDKEREVMSQVNNWTSAVRLTRFGQTLTRLEQASGESFLPAPNDLPEVAAQKMRTMQTMMDEVNAGRLSLMNPGAIAAFARQANRASARQQQVNSYLPPGATP